LTDCNSPAAYCWRHFDSQKAISPARTSMDPREDEAERGGPRLGLRLLLSTWGYRKIPSLREIVWNTVN